ncbi:MAG TPA: preprotein translocase subunit SecG [Gammaproteobacteria bacterium]|nr:preprotein translocase subunit SecG [Gammaproteobacteria bacterium]
MLYTILEIILVFVAVTLVIFILLQQGKGADAGAAFGSGASGTVFGAGGSANFLSRATAILATMFFILALSMAYLSHRNPAIPQSIVERAAQQQAAAVKPATPQAPPAIKTPAATSKPSGNPSPAQPPVH